VVATVPVARFLGPALSNLEESNSALYTKKHYPNGSLYPSSMNTWHRQIPIVHNTSKALNAPFCFVLSAFSFGASLLLLVTFLAGLPFLVPLVSPSLQIPDISSSFANSSKCTILPRAFSIFYWWVTSRIGHAPCWAALVSPFGSFRVSFYFGSPYSFNALFRFVLSAFSVWLTIILDTLSGLVVPTLSNQLLCDLFILVITALNALFRFVLSAFSVLLTIILCSLLFGSLWPLLSLHFTPNPREPSLVRSLLQLYALFCASRFQHFCLVFLRHGVLLLGGVERYGESLVRI